MKHYIFLIYFIIAVTVGLFGVPAQAVYAQEGEVESPSDNEVNAIAKQLYCPVCENIPLDVCPTQACTEWRELIRLKLSEGWSAQQIKDYFVEQYGDRVLATPPPKGFNWLVYVIPPIVILGGAYILFRAFKSMRQASTEAGPVMESPPDLKDEYVERLEQELKNR